MHTSLQYRIHNYYLYEKDDKLTMIPRDCTLAFGGTSATNATNTVNTPINDLVSSIGRFGASVGSDRPMAAWIMNIEAATAQHPAFYHAFMDKVFQSGWFNADFDRVTEMLDPYVQNNRAPFCTHEEYQTASAPCGSSACAVRRMSVASRTVASPPPARDSVTASPW